MCECVGEEKHTCQNRWHFLHTHAGGYYYRVAFCAVLTLFLALDMTTLFFPSGLPCDCRRQGGREERERERSR